MEPYRGLQPYTEEYEEFFFGRDVERAILIDKILSDKLTLLFSATGVGKSSLLQAAVMPELKRPARENLDVIYYNDWVTPPLTGLKQKILTVLQERGKIATDFQFPSWEGPGVGDSPLEGGQGGVFSLKQFLHICATFASEPLVIILDQFEEFFQYQRYTEHFTPFIAQLSEAIRDRETPVAFLISMREDFALNLNAFKEYLPTTLFENYFRLEKLEIKEAEEAISKPVEKVSFRYEEGLLQTLLKDLADQERESRIGSQKELIPETAPAFVEPPNVQIVCTQLWEEEKNNPDRIIHTKTYNEKGGSKGFITTYFERVITKFSKLEQKIASKAFDHLVTPRGTKMAYPVKDLSELLRVDEHDLGNVLAKLEKARVLRSQSREGVLWYELYHDTFSDIIYQWNNDYKTKQRTKRLLTGLGITLAILLLIFSAYDVISNLMKYHFRLSAKRISNQIELYRGKSKSWDIAHLQRYEAEASFTRNKLEPDKQFTEKSVAEYEEMNLELIGQLSIIERILAYWEMGEIEMAFRLADRSISTGDIAKTQEIIDLLVDFRSQKSFEVLNRHLASSENDYIRTYIISAVSSTQFVGVTDCFINFLSSQSSDVRSSAVMALGQLGSNEAVNSIVKLLKDQNPDVRSSAAKALGKLGNEKTVESLIELLQDQNTGVQRNAVISLGQIGDSKAVSPLVELIEEQNTEFVWAVASALAQIGSQKAVEPLVKVLEDPSQYHRYYERLAIARTLAQIDNKKAVKPLIELLKDPDESVWRQAIIELYRLSSDAEIIDLLRNNDMISLLTKLLRKEMRGTRIYFGDEQNSVIGLFARIENNEAIKQLLKLIKDQDSYVRSNAAEALGVLGSDKVIEPLVELLKDQNRRVCGTVAETLGNLGYYEAVEPLVKLLKDQNKHVRNSAAKALGELGNSKAIEPLIRLLAEEQDSEVQSSVALALGQIADNNTIEPLVELLKSQNKQVRNSAVIALGQLGIDSGIIPLIRMLEDQEADVRRGTAEVLGKFGTGESFDILLDLLGEQYKHVYRFRYGSWTLSEDLRENTAKTLGKLGSYQAVEQLLEILREQRRQGYSAVGSSAMEALGEIGCTEAIALLVKILNKQQEFSYSYYYPTWSIAIKALGNLGSKDAMKPLLKQLKEGEPNVQAAAAEVLAQFNSDEAIEPLIDLLKSRDEDVKSNAAAALGKLSADKAIDALKILYEKNSQIKVTVSAVLLSLNQKDGLEFLKERSESKKVKARKDVAIALGVASSEQGNKILLSMLSDENVDVKMQVIASLGKSQTTSVLPHLHQLIEDSNPKIRKAVVGALAEIVSPESVNFLRQTALNTEERVPTRIAAITGLGKIGTEDAAATLLEVLENTDEHYYYKTVIALGKTRSSQALSKLVEMLKEQEHRKAKWRKIRDENIDGYTDEQVETWRKRLEVVEPQTYMEFELAHAIAQIDPGNEGVKLLSHDLAKVREGAWMGLARLPLTEKKPFYLTAGPKAVALIERLDRERMQSKHPLFRHAAYRAIDGMLITIEAYGSKPDLKALEAFLPKVQDQEGVLTRVEWTIARLKEREEDEE